MNLEPRWTRNQLQEEASASRELFRRHRLQEPLERWKRVCDQYIAAFSTLLQHFRAGDPWELSRDQLEAIFANKTLASAFRYLAGPPISADDLKVLAETTLAPGSLRRAPEAAKRILETVLAALDTRRMPWIAERRPATEVELSTAILSSAVLLTNQKVSTDRRNEGKDEQEKAVKTFLEEMGFREVRARTIRTLDDAPRVQEFCGESLVGSRKADIAVRLFDGRLMPIECKVSK